MEKLRRVVSEIAYTPLSQRHSTLSPLQLSLVPLLSFASSLYSLTLSLRHSLYHLGLLHKHRLPVPVISVGNLTWGGNGKTPMVEFVALWLANCGISPLILTRGYGDADEAKMLQRHLQGSSAKIGVGANRAATAARFFERYGYINHCNSTCFERRCSDQKARIHLHSDKIGAAILDDGMQHLSLCRDIEIVMVNGMKPWGNHQLLPLGPLREPFTALNRANVLVVHHADLVLEQNMEIIESTLQEVGESLPIFFTIMAPSHFFKVDNISFQLPLSAVYNTVVLCVSAIGSADSFIQRIEKMKPLNVDRLDFSDHHVFQAEDIDMIRTRLLKLQAEFASKPIVVVTEKDYDRDPEVLKLFTPYEVLVLCSQLEILPRKGRSEDNFKELLKQLF